jgi:beta-mannosidase
MFTLSLTAQTQLIPLNRWEFSAYGDNRRMPAEVPGNIFTDLEKNGQISNPLKGTTERDVQWVSRQTWEYTTIPFSFPALGTNEEACLILPSLDTYADIYVNGNFALRVDNAFRTWRIYVSDWMQLEGNVIQVIFKSPYEIAEQKLQRISYPIPGDSIRAVTRKPQYEFGWDWGPSLAGCGIRSTPYLEINQGVQFSSLYLIQPQESDPKFDLHYTIQNKKNQSLQIQLIEKKTQRIVADHLLPNQTTLEGHLPFDVSQAWNIGQKNTLDEYEIVVSSGGKTVLTRSFPISKRTVKLVQEPDEWGTGFYFRVNGKRTFMKGANYIPIRYFHEQATEEDYRKLISRCVEANINMLRVWGGGLYEPEIFYRLCDENGIMIWQDFMFACSMYPGDEGFLHNVKQEAQEHVQRLSFHPCMALWCGNNENSEGWEKWGWQMGLSENSKNKLNKAYQQLFHQTLPNAVKQYSSLDYWPSSPLFGRGDVRSLSQGDSHYWGVWHDAEPFDVLETKIPRFMSEYGMQSYPSPEVLEEMATTQTPNEKDPGCLQHQKHNRGFHLMHQYMKYWHPKGEILPDPDYAKLTQYVQAEGMIMGIEAHRRHSDRCGGTLFWQLNDVWPSYSWSAMDWHFTPKPFMEQLTFAYAPILISVEGRKNKKMDVYCINDSGKILHDIQYTLTVYSHGKVLQQKKGKISDMQEGSHVFEHLTGPSAYKKKHPSDLYLEMVLTGSDLEGGRYERICKLSPESQEMLVPQVYQGHWTVGPLLGEPIEIVR